MTSHAARRRPAKGGWSLVAPALIVLVVLTLWPLGQAVRTSLYRESLTTPDDTSFAGAHNYVEVFESLDWWVAVALTLVFVAVVVVLQLLLAAGFAAALRRITVIAPYTRVLVLVPFAVMATVVAFVWREGDHHRLRAVVVPLHRGRPGRRPGVGCRWRGLAGHGHHHAHPAGRTDAGAAGTAGVGRR